jgi:quercetin dioxygenase-like cupin family protein
VGIYEVLTDFVTPQASIRVIRMAGAAERVEQHIHHKSTQIYLSLSGDVRIVVDGVEQVLPPYEAVAVHPGIPHGASPVGAEAILANISVPALSPDDQLPVEDQPEPPDLALPGPGSDVED